MTVAECSREAVTSGSATPKVRLSMLLDSTLPLSFWSKVHAHLSGCWLWMAYRDRDGYGTFRIPDGAKKKAHRVAYEHLVGAIPDGMTLDHLCRNRACVNPSHLEPVTDRDNILRGIGLAAMNAQKTHCKHGHPYDVLNTLYSMGRRYCRTCKTRSERAFKERKRLMSCVGAGHG